MQAITRTISARSGRAAALTGVRLKHPVLLVWNVCAKGRDMRRGSLTVTADFHSPMLPKAAFWKDRTVPGFSGWYVLAMVYVIYRGINSQQALPYRLL